MFERWRKLTDEKLSELFERNGINESAIFEKDVPHPAQVNSVQGVYINIPAAFINSSATFVFVPLGIKITHRLNAHKLRLAFTIFLGISGAKMLSEGVL